MVETMVSTLINLFSDITTTTFGKALVVFIISMIPILELRGGLIAAALLNLDPVISIFVSIIGNLLPIPFILWFINSILNKMRDTKLFSKLVKKLYKKVSSKKSSIEKYGFIGLLLFVGIPLPGTGAWTGSLIASILEMDKKKSLKYIFLGILLASVIMMIVSFGIIKNLI